MTVRAESETPQFAKFLPWQIRIAIGVTFLVVIFSAIMAVPGGPWNVWGALVYVVGFVTYWMLVNRSVVLRLEEQSVRIQLGRRTVEVPYEEITEVAVGTHTPWWQIGRRDVGDGSTGYLVGGSSVRMATEEGSVVVSTEGSYRVAGAIQRRIDHVTEGRAAGTG